MLVVDPLAERRRGGGELDARVHALRLGCVRGDVCDDAVAVLDEVANRIGQVELALSVVGLEPVEGGPEQFGLEHVDRGVALRQLELIRRRVGGFDDRVNGAVSAANDTTV